MSDNSACRHQSPGWAERWKVLSDQFKEWQLKLPRLDHWRLECPDGWSLKKILGDYRSHLRKTRPKIDEETILPFESNLKHLIVEYPTSRDLRRWEGFATKLNDEDAAQAHFRFEPLAIECRRLLEQVGISNTWIDYLYAADKEKYCLIEVPTLIPYTPVRLDPKYCRLQDVFAKSASLAAELAVEPERSKQIGFLVNPNEWKGEPPEPSDKYHLWVEGQIAENCERGLLSALFVDPSVILTVRTLVTGSDFIERDLGRCSMQS